MSEKDINQEFISKCENGTIEEIQNLINLNGSNINLKSLTTQRSIHLICQFQNQENSLEIIKYLVENGINANSKNNKREAPLHLICQYQTKNEYSIEIMKYLLSKGADINSKCFGNQTPLHYAYETVLHLICQYHFQNEQEKEKEKSFEIFKYLIEKEADINAKNKENETPLHLICEYQQKKENLFEVIKYLIEKEADINAKNKENETPLHLICEFQNKENALEVIKYLIGKGADVNAKNDKNETPLHYALKYYFQYLYLKENAFEVIKYLILRGADINIPNKTNETPLHLVCKSQQNQQNSLEMAKYLIKMGSNVNAKADRNETPLHYVCEFQKSQENSIKIAKALIKNGANVDAAAKGNRIALYFAIQKGNLKLVELLLMNDADLVDLATAPKLTPEINENSSQIYSINEDLNNLLKSNENFSDFQIQSNDSFKFQVHKKFLLLRFDNDEKILQKFIDICSQKSKEDVQIALNFLYTGFTDFDYFIESFNNFIRYYNEHQKITKAVIEKKISYPQHNRRVVINSELFQKEKSKKIEKSKKENEMILTLFKEIGIDSNWIEIKKGRKGIIKDLSKLYEENETKDFKIIFDNEKEIKVHKLILIIRSELFKGMFLNVQDKSNQVHDYSGKSFETIQEFIYFIYHDKFSKNIKKEKEIILEEYFDLKDYYQLNQNSIIDLFLKEEKEN
ncbi:ankyrin repeat [Anaeramoeba ignava]|uniref:Ankyrin repeat n=1 Tax=Anaeramoeba ignava TaxID=1746090 RepID=A0A9Q0LFS6_ANAIG|nr:ankyrin repeat [Anaeramoeba ignava]